MADQKLLDANGSEQVSVPTVAAAAISGTITAGQGGTGQNTGASTGIPKILSGVWSVISKLSLALGGTNADLSSTGGANQFLKQSGSGSDVTVGAIGASDLTAALASPPAIGTTTPAAGYFSALREKIGGFFAIFTHANSADRTYTFPDYDGTVATLGGTETLTSKTLTTPTVTSLTNMQHNHTNAAGGGQITDAALSAAVSLAKGGTAVDNSSQTANKVFASPVSGGAGAMSVRALVDADIPVTLAAHTINGATLTGAIDANAATMRAPVSAGGALTTTEGYWEWDSTNKCLKFYDGTRERIVGGWGYQPFAQPISYSSTSSLATSVSLAANGGTALTPIILTGHMLLQAVTIFSADTATARTWGWDLYVDLDNSNNAIARVATGASNETFTPSAATQRTIAASVTPVYLPPGTYYIAIQNRHASNTFALGATTGGNGLFPITNNKFKTTTNPNGATLDIIAATWSIASGASAALGINLRGRAAGDTVAW